ncbi:hypothetical protein [Sediminibacter sp. Hel_I_10]|uniref:hypothetical protein n=1 Tax=Sediminibacter sp. Hel_I_10 TaxID=1392490 RepID=UPI00047BC95E|nr:hypothetical protein [Sediminibacter sp. Hel_I_10]
MKLLKQAFCATVFTIVFSSAFNMSHAQGSLSLQAQSSVKFDAVYFQEWYAGIKVGGTGFNIFLPNVNKNQDIVMQDVYFRNLKGKLNKVKDKYVATLKNPSPHYTFKTPEKPKDYPFDLKDSECVISYLENGQTKYLKIAVLNERAGTYYENGPPSIYDDPSSRGLATLDSDD